eukprot:6191756-Pleurochrysis_carterae.AAC.3
MTRAPTSRKRRDWRVNEHGKACEAGARIGCVCAGARARARVRRWDKEGGESMSGRKKGAACVCAGTIANVPNGKQQDYVERHAANP